MTHDDYRIGRHFRIARVLPRLAFILSLLAVLPAAAQDGGEATVTQTQCSDNWYVSSAHLSCRTELSISVSDNQCHISVKCQNAYYTHAAPNDNLVANDITDSLANTANLSNCNGVLTVGSC